MKSPVKTAALVILVSLGVVACKSTGRGIFAPKTPINKQLSTQQQKNTQTQSSTQTQPNPVELAVLTELPKEPEISKPVNILDRKGKEWRIINIYQDGPGNRYTTEYRYNHHLEDMSSGFLPMGTPGFFGANTSYNLNLNELDTKDGKPFLGVHQGTVVDPNLHGKKTIEVELNKDNQAKNVKTVDTKEFNYLYVNQPYSTYGALFTNGHEVRFFSVAQSAGQNTDSDVYPVWDREYVTHSNGAVVDTGKIIWNDAVAGEATYKGLVIASVERAHFNGAPTYFNGIRSVPELDGTVTLNATFDKDPERSFVSGEIDSKQVGKIVLEKEKLNTGHTPPYSENVINGQFKYKGMYDAHFSGKDLNDVVGKVHLRKHESVNKGDIVEYNAIFGATKQPK